VHVGGDPDRIADILPLDEGEDVGEFKLAAARAPPSPCAIDSWPQRLSLSWTRGNDSGMSQAMTFHSAVEALSSRLSHATCAGAK